MHDQGKVITSLKNAGLSLNTHIRKTNAYQKHQLLTNSLIYDALYLILITSNVYSSYVVSIRSYRWLC